MLGWDDIGDYEAVTPDQWNRMILETLAPAVRARGERWARSGTVALTWFDRQRSLYVVNAMTCAPGRGPREVPAGLALQPYQFRLPTAGVLRRVYCRDGNDNASERVRVELYDNANAYDTSPTGFPLAAPPFDVTDLNFAVATNKSFRVWVDNGGATQVEKNYRVTLEFALDFAAGTA